MILKFVAFRCNGQPPHYLCFSLAIKLTAIILVAFYQAFFGNKTGGLWGGQRDANIHMHAFGVTLETILGPQYAAIFRRLHSQVESLRLYHPHEE